jgi:CheY-like chemotaxis protein
MSRICLIHWNPEEAAQRAESLRAAGHDVRYEPLTGPQLLRALRADPPDAFLIDLGRLPSQGRDVALSLRQAKATRNVPLVFVGGDPQKVDRTRQLLPDAVYADWPHIDGALREALAQPPASPIVPGSVLAGYSGTPLPKKLGIKPGAKVVLTRAPERFRETLGPLPEGARLHEEGRGGRDLTIWFLRSADELLHDLRRIVEAAGHGPVWMAWPKKASGTPTDLSEPTVREAGLAAGLVDYKVCAIDATWSGLLFRRRASEPR